MFLNHGTPFSSVCQYRRGRDDFAHLYIYLCTIVNFIVLIIIMHHHPGKLTPTQLMGAGRHADGAHLLKSSQFLQVELPRRIARRVKDFQSLPYVVALNPTLQEVYELYLRAFDRLSR